jgi:hypothetical protein
MEALLSKYSAAEYEVIADYFEQTSKILGEEAARLRDSGKKAVP